MQAFEQQPREAECLAMGGQIVDATLVPAPKRRNNEDEKAAIKAGKSARQIWRGKPNKAHREPQTTPTGRQRRRCTLDSEDLGQDPLYPSGEDRGVIRGLS